MKPLFLLLCLASLNRLQAQAPGAPLVAAEKSFAAYSVAHGTRDAFLQYLDSNGIVFEGGQPVKGIPLWQVRENRPGVLNWRPLYAGIAASGDLGFTTGPWTFQKTPADSIVARGTYATVWHRTSGGAWKFLVDLGVGNTPPAPDAAVQFLNEGAAYKPADSLSLLGAEQAFIQASAEPEKAYRSFLAPHFVLNRNGRAPLTGSGSLASLLATQPAPIEYTVLGSGLSASGDLGYVYGILVHEGKSENYLRVWQRRGNEWKIVLEVLRY